MRLFRNLLHLDIMLGNDKFYLSRAKTERKIPYYRWFSASG